MCVCVCMYVCKSRIKRLINRSPYCKIDGGDYIGGTRQINVLAQTTTQSFTLPIINDDTVECVEAFSVVIISVTTCGVTISNNRTEVMINDDDGKQIFCETMLYTVHVSVILEYYYY